MSSALPPPAPPPVPGPSLADRLARLSLGVQIGGVLITLVGVAVAAATFLNGGPRERAGHATVSSVIVRNKRFDSDNVGLHGRQTLGSTPTADVTLLNTTDDPVLITRATFEVRKSVAVPQCFAQGGGDTPSSRPETISLPSPFAAEPSVITRAQHHQIDAHDSARLIYRFRVPSLGADDYTLSLVHITLTTSSNVLTVGDVVLSSNSAVSRGGQHFPEDDAVLGFADDGPHLESTWCYRHNLKAAREVRSWDGGRAPETEALANVAPGNSWRRFQDRTPARRAALRMSDPVGVYGLEFAVFAAEATHDPEFVELIRRRCATVLLKDARSGMRQGATDFAASEVARARALADGPAVEAVAKELRRRRSMAP